MALDERVFTVYSTFQKKRLVDYSGRQVPATTDNILRCPRIRAMFLNEVYHDIASCTFVTEQEEGAALESLVRLRKAGRLPTTTGRVPKGDLFNE